MDRVFSLVMAFILSATLVAAVSCSQPEQSLPADSLCIYVQEELPDMQAKSMGAIAYDGSATDGNAAVNAYMAVMYDAAGKELARSAWSPKNGDPLSIHGLVDPGVYGFRIYGGIGNDDLSSVYTIAETFNDGISVIPGQPVVLLLNDLIVSGNTDGFSIELEMPYDTASVNRSSSSIAFTSSTGTSATISLSSCTITETKDDHDRIESIKAVYTGNLPIGISSVSMILSATDVAGKSSTYRASGTALVYAGLSVSGSMDLKQGEDGGYLEIPPSLADALSRRSPFSSYKALVNHGLFLPEMAKGVTSLSITNFTSDEGPLEINNGRSSWLDSEYFPDLQRLDLSGTELDSSYLYLEGADNLTYLTINNTPEYSLRVYGNIKDITARNSDYLSSFYVYENDVLTDLDLYNNELSTVGVNGDVAGYGISSYPRTTDEDGNYWYDMSESYFEDIDINLDSTRTGGRAKQDMRSSLTRYGSTEEEIIYVTIPICSRDMYIGCSVFDDDGDAASSYKRYAGDVYYRKQGNSSWTRATSNWSNGYYAEIGSRFSIGTVIEIKWEIPTMTQTSSRYMRQLSISPYQDRTTHSG